MPDKNKTKKCPSCQSEIPIGANKCPECQTDLRSWLRRHPILSVLGALFIFGFILSIIGAGNTTVPESDSLDTQDQTPQAQTEVDEEKTEKELLQLVSFNCYEEYDYFHITGEVKNISNKSLEEVVAVGTAYTQEGEFVKKSDALIDYNPILPDQTSPFEVIMTHNPAMAKCNVAFKKFWGGTIPTKRE